MVPVVTFDNSLHDWDPANDLPSLAIVGFDMEFKNQSCHLRRQQRAQEVTIWIAYPTGSCNHKPLSSPRLTNSSGYSGNCSGPRTEMESAHVEIPISNDLYLWTKEVFSS